MRAAPWLAVVLVLAAPAGAAAQSVVPGSVAAERARLFEIVGADSVRRAVRGDTALTDWIPFLRRVPYLAGARLFVAEPELRFTWNSAIPYSLNDGPMWAGRGSSVTAGGGLGFEHRDRLDRVRVRLTVAPALVYSQNLPFDVIPSTAPARSAYSSPFHGPDASADVPIRFGDRYLARVVPGRSALAVTIGKVTTGLTAENEIWGPGIRNALVMSANAEGVPRVYLRPALPVKTRAGIVDARLIAGTLTESFFFDDSAANDFRAVSGFLVQVRPTFDTSLTLGLTRAVYAPIGSRVRGALSHGLDALLRWEYIARPGDTTAQGAPAQRADQIMSAFARWTVPAAGGGLEVYGEFARMDFPRTFTELLSAAHHSGGYTLGLQWAQPRRHSDYLRLQAEVTYLEQSRVFDDRPTNDFYTGKVSAQGYTQRGQVIGAAIGPGASSQFAAVDYIATALQFGVYAGRIRWDNDALYRLGFPTLFKHDVTVLGGLRGAVRSRWSDVSADVAFGYRYNFLFQNGLTNFGGFRTVDVRNVTISLAITPR